MTREAITAIGDRVRRTWADPFGEWPSLPVFMVSIGFAGATVVLAIRALMGKEATVEAIAAGVTSAALGRIWWTITPPDNDGL